VTFRDELIAAARASQRPLEPAIVEACSRHFDLLLRWNQTHNLTRIVAAPEAARKHYLDCVVPLLDAREGGLEPASFVDVGSGAGFPGLLACLVWPNARATLVEPAQKRASFLMLAAQAMGVKVTVVASVVDAVRSVLLAVPGSPDSAPDTASRASPGIVLSRATFSPGKRSELVRAAGDAIALWGHPHDGSTWKSEVSTWGDWRVAEQAYAVEGLEPRSLLWALRGEFHVKHSQPIR
jgi:hypothetical protein